MTIRPGTRAALLAVALAMSGFCLACSQPSSQQAPTTTVSNSTVPSQPTTGTNTMVPPGPTTGGEPICDPPTLRVLTPAEGSRVMAPFPLTYETRCFPTGRDGTIIVAADGMRIDLDPTGATGAVTVPDHPLLAGRRTVTIQLAHANGQLLANPEATVVMTLIIEGSR